MFETTQCTNHESVTEIVLHERSVETVNFRQQRVLLLERLPFFVFFLFLRF